MNEWLAIQNYFDFLCANLEILAPIGQRPKYKLQYKMKLMAIWHQLLLIFDERLSIRVQTVSNLGEQFDFNID